MLTALSAHPWPPGRLVALHVRPAFAGIVPADSRPPSYNQESHLRTEEALLHAESWAPTWLATAFDVPDTVDIEQLRRACVAWVQRHEALRTGLTRVEDELRRFTYTPEQLTVRPALLGDFASGEEVRQRMEALFDEETDALSPWPAYVIAVLSHERATTVIAAFDHSVTDGHSNVSVPYEFQEMLAAGREERPVDLPDTGSHVDYSAAERSAAAKVDDAHPAVAVWRKFRDTELGTSGAFPVDPGLDPGDVVASTAHRETLLGAEDTAEFEAACADSGGRFQTGLLAVCALAAFEAEGTEEFRATLPMHARRRTEWASSHGWYVNVLPFHLSVRGTESFAEANAAAVASIRSAIPALRVPRGRVEELIGSVSDPPFNVSYMDFRVVPGIENWSVWNVCNFGKFIQTDGWHTGLWFHQTDDGLSVTMAYADTDTARGTAHSYVDRLRDMMRAVAGTGSRRTAPD